MYFSILVLSTLTMNAQFESSVNLQFLISFCCKVFNKDFIASRNELSQNFEEYQFRLFNYLKNQVKYERAVNLYSSLFSSYFKEDKHNFHNISTLYVGTTATQTAISSNRLINNVLVLQATSLRAFIRLRDDMNVNLRSYFRLTSNQPKQLFTKIQIVSLASSQSKLA